jgi:hypothetical protein
VTREPSLAALLHLVWNLALVRAAALPAAGRTFAVGADHAATPTGAMQGQRGHCSLTCEVDSTRRLIEDEAHCDEAPDVPDRQSAVVGGGGCGGGLDR